MRLIGLTGGIASGKSTACDYIKRHSNIPIISADEIAHKLFHKHNHHIATLFPELNRNDVVTREEVAELVFRDVEKRRKLERFFHPLVRKCILVKLFIYWISGYRMIILDLPLLFEQELDRLMSEVVLIYCSSVTQLRRLKDRNDFTLEQASIRLQAQIPLAEKLSSSDVVINNDGSLDDLYNQLNMFIIDLQQSTTILDTILFYIIPMMFLFLLVLKITSFVIDVLL